jgi:hypothetical protein
MRTIKAVMCLAMVLLLAHAVHGDDAKKSAPPLSWYTTMPAIEISRQPLEKVMNDLKKKLPGFEFSISRENVPHDYPVLPAMSVENVSIEQFLALVTTEVPGVTVTYGVSGDGLLAEINIVPNPNAVATTQPTVVRVFGLAELIAFRSTSIEGVEKREDREKQASNEILSMIQAALDVAGDPTVPVMKMHAPTKTLIFKGTDAQAQIVESAIKALHSGDGIATNLLYDQDRQLKSENRKLSDEVFGLKSSLQDYKDALQNARAAATKPSK